MTKRAFWAAALITNLTAIVGFLVLRIDAALYVASVGCVVVVVLGVVLLARPEPGAPSTEAVEPQAGSL